jgi:NAD(P)-dependent dehydrogenase (short-subunit alcohol dehydrogenase family)
VHLTKTLAVQLGRFGITVNCIHPGTTRPERTPRLLAARRATPGAPCTAEKRPPHPPTRMDRESTPSRKMFATD